MQFTKCVIGPNYIPVGFVYEDKGVEHYEDFASLCRKKASDGTLYFSDSGVIGLYNHAVNAIDICRETVGGGYSKPIDPSLTLLRRIVSGGTVVGFEVQDSTGTKVKKHIASILSASKYMKPANYMVVERNGNQFLRGKGTVLGELPFIDITPEITTPTRVRIVRNEPQDIVDPRLTKGVSLVNVIEIVRECGGAIFKLPQDKYKPIGETHVEDGLDFNRVTGASEVAPALLEASTKKLTASFNYRVLGTVMTTDDGTAMAYIYRKKNIVNVHYAEGVLRGDKVRLERIGLAIPATEASKFQKAIAGTVAVVPLESKSAEDTAIKLVKMVNPVLYAIDLKEISVLGAEYEDYLMAGEQIKANLEHIAKHKYVAKFLKELIKEYAKKGMALKSEGLWKYYQRLSANSLQELQADGVDLSTGLYTNPLPQKTTNSQAIKTQDAVEIIYELATPLESVPKEVIGISLKDLPSVVQSVLQPVFDEVSVPKKLELATKIAEISEAAYKRSELALFEHKLAMVLDGHNVVHSHDKMDWTPMKVSARSQYMKYANACGVVMKLKNIEMSR